MSEAHEEEFESSLVAVHPLDHPVTSTASSIQQRITYRLPSIPFLARWLHPISDTFINPPAASELFGFSELQSFTALPTPTPLPQTSSQLPLFASSRRSRRIRVTRGLVRVAGEDRRDRADRGPRRLLEGEGQQRDVGGDPACVGRKRLMLKEGIDVKGRD
jgi:hypothetical protein